MKVKDVFIHVAGWSTVIILVLLLLNFSFGKFSVTDDTLLEVENKDTAAIEPFDLFTEGFSFDNLIDFLMMLWFIAVGVPLGIFTFRQFKK